MACSALITPAAAAAVISPTEWPAPAPTWRKPSAGCSNSASRLTSPLATMSGWAIAVSLMVSASDVVPWATRSMSATADSQVSRSRKPGQLEPRGEEAGGLGALAGADDDEHEVKPSGIRGREAVGDADELCPADLEDSYKDSMAGSATRGRPGRGGADARRPRARALRRTKPSRGSVGS